MKNIYKIITIALLALVPVATFAIPATTDQSSGFISPRITTDYMKAAYFVASSTATKSTFPYASTTVISATGICISTDCRTAWPLSGGGSGGGTWSTTTSTVSGQLVNYPNNTTDIPTIGSTSTTTAKFWFDPNTSIGFIRGNLGIGTTSPYASLSVVGNSGVVAEKYTATSTSAFSTFAGRVGVATTSPTQKLEVSDGNIFISSASGAGRSLTLSTDVMDDGSRASIKFLRNNFAPFLGDDHSSQSFNFMTALASTRVFSATVRAYGLETGGFANYAGMTHDGTDGHIITGFGDLILTPATLRVGIGTSSPASELNVSATLPEITWTDSDASTNQKHWFAEADSGVFSIGTTSDQLVKTATRALSIGTTGNVGIGTTSPSARLDIYNGANVNTGLFIEAGATGAVIAQFARRAGAIADLKIMAGSGDPQFVFSSNNTDGYSMGYDISNSSFNIAQSSAIGSSDRLVVKGANVGIGTTSPYAKLSVVGEVVGSHFTATSTTATSTFKGGLNLMDATVQRHEYPTFTYATSTTWTGTTTIPLGVSYTIETWVGVKCYTDVGTLNVSFNDGSNRMNMFNASTTVGTVLLNTNNTYVTNEKRFIDIGTPATSPTKISCTVDKIINQ